VIGFGEQRRGGEEMDGRECGGQRPGLILSYGIWSRGVKYVYTKPAGGVGRRET